MNTNAHLLCELFKDNKPFLIGRNGTIELEVILFYLNYRNKRPYPIELINKLELHAGIFPAEEKFVDDWAKEYIEAIKGCDVFAEGWYEPLKENELILLNIINPLRKSILLRNLEPYYVESDLRWSQHLANKKVAIINSFATTCQEQTYMAKAIWGEENSHTLLPESTKWIPIQTYYSPSLALGKCGWSLDSWKDAVDSIVKQTVEANPSIAIIGCGGLGMIIGKELKKNGIQVIIMGGSTQILFGIKGKRWLNHSVISQFMNDAWVFPSDDNIPNGSKNIEGGCYWS